ncbi:MAG TPA: hypothetical protein VFQ42_04625 [Mycobacterium sp.]|nr:hypothetical protein [Mycobacterium sp.]
MTTCTGSTRFDFVTATVFWQGSVLARHLALEREAAATPGTLYYGHLLYEDDTAYPRDRDWAPSQHRTAHRTIPQPVPIDMI